MCCTKPISRAVTQILYRSNKNAVIADGDAGVAVCDPTAATIAAYEAKREIQLRRQRELQYRTDRN